jgi:hypothetical protein
MNNTIRLNNTKRIKQVISLACLNEPSQRFEYYEGTTIHYNSRLELIHLPCAIQDHQVNAFGITQLRFLALTIFPAQTLITLYQTH